MDGEVVALDYELDAEGISDLRKSGKAFTILDVREPWEYDSAQIPGSTLIPMGDIPSRAHQELDPDDHIVVVCHRGVRSLSVTNWLRQQGFDKAQSVRGGIDAWIDEAFKR